MTKRLHAIGLAAIIAASAAWPASAQMRDQTAPGDRYSYDRSDRMQRMEYGKKNDSDGHMKEAKAMMKIMFAIVDANGDGAVSFNEVIELHKRVFDAVDANNNGRVTPEEIEAFFHD